VITLFAKFIFYVIYKIQYGKGKDTQVLKVNVTENLNHDHLFDDIFNEYTESYALRQIETTNIGTMILYTYAIRSKNDVNDKDIIDEIREKNANLKVTLSYLNNED